MLKIKTLAVVVLACIAGASAGGCSRGSKSKESNATGQKWPTSSPATPAPVPQGPARAVAGATLAQLALDQLGELQKSTSLGEWRGAHKDDEVSLYHAGTSEPTNEDWCARSIAQVVDGDKTMRRTAYFYPPPAPEPLAVPDETPEQLRNQCRLGLVWIETADVDARRATDVTDEVNQAITTNLGAGTANLKLAWWNAASWRRTSRWTMSDVAMVLASTEAPAWKVEREAKPTRVFVAAAGPASGITFLLRSSAASEASLVHKQMVSARVDEAMRLAGLDDSTDRPLRDFVTLFEAKEAEFRVLTVPERTQFIDALERWMKASADLPAMRRTAALVAADQILNESYSAAGWAEPRQSALRKRLQASGATFAESKLGNVFVYTHSWVKQADRLNAGGRASELAFLTLMSMGFETSGMCLDQGNDGFNEVIRRGEEFLRTHPGASITKDVHILLAEAYADIVALADGAGGDLADADAYKADADRARGRALGELRSVLTDDASSAQSKLLWPTAWRLAAGLAPTRTKFFCIYD